MSEAIERYLKEVVPFQKNHALQKVYLRFWKEKLGAYTLADIKPSLVLEVRNGLIGTVNGNNRAIGHSTANRYVGSLNALLNKAFKEWEWMSENPIANVSKYKEPRGRVRFLAEDERDRLLKSALDSPNSYLYPVIVLALSTGARKMEILALKWSDIDFNRSVITLHETKNEERRVLPLHGHALKIVQQHKSQRIIGCDYLFPSRKIKRDEKGRPMFQPMEIRKPWENALLEANIEDFRFHDLRHSAASYLAMNGASLAEIADILGHKTLSMVKRYAHLSEAHTSSVVASMNEKVFGDG